MSERAPEFSDDDPGWIRLDVLRPMLGIKHAQMQRIRKQLGNAFEFPPEKQRKPGKPVWVYGPLWLSAWAQLQEPPPGSNATGKTSFKDLREKYQAHTARLDLLERRKRLIDVEKFCEERLYPFCDELRRSIEILGRVSPEAQRIILDGLASAEAKINLNGHLHPQTPPATNGNGHSGRAAVRARAAKGTAQPS